MTTTFGWVVVGLFAFFGIARISLGFRRRIRPLA